MSSPPTASARWSGCPTPARHLERPPLWWRQVPTLLSRKRGRALGRSAGSCGPPRGPGFSLAATYFDTYYYNRIESIVLEPDVLNQPEFAWLVTRDFSAAERSADLQADRVPGYHRSLSQRTDRCDRRQSPAKYRASADERHRPHRKVCARQLARHASTSGSTERTCSATQRRRLREAPTVELLNTQTNPINLRLRGVGFVGTAGLGASAFVNFDNGYRDIASEPNRSVRSWTTFDLQLRYRIGRDAAGPLSNTEIRYQCAGSLQLIATLSQ